MKHFVVYDPVSGEPLRSGVCQDIDLQMQAGEGEAVMETTAAAQVVVEIDLTPVKEALYNKIDAAAEAFCLRFITAGYTQAMRYMEKRIEAAAWVPSSSDPAAFPFLAAEAAATDVTIDELAETIKATSAAWTALGAAVEGKRMAAKKAVAASSNLAEMDAASNIDWASLLT